VPKTATSAPDEIRIAFETHDHDRIVRVLAPDVVLNSPIVDTPFRGRDEVADLYAALLDTFEQVTYVAETEADGAHIVVFTATVKGTPLEGVDIIRLNDTGQVREMTIFMRPLRGVAAFVEEIGPRLARRRGKSVALVRVATPPATAMMRVLARFAPRMTGVGRRG
jgi:SnoaL-like domain